jgi:2-keto-4-pentenoate hydratase/2-oxohepta-3-ene-1,7-dioic acid hydratase in catechol pathway
MYPPSVRVFTPFERGETPFYSFRSPFPVLGPDADLPYPDVVGELDYGLALAAMIGAEDEIAGFTVANDWSDRVLARAERAAGFGPGRSGDFALSLGPVLVTPDELGETRLVARVNGEERCGADTRELVHRWPELVAAAGRLRPGDLLLARVSGGAGPALRPGDVVELEAEGIGVLRNTVA